MCFLRFTRKSGSSSCFREFSYEWLGLFRKGSRSVQQCLIAGTREGELPLQRWIDHRDSARGTDNTSKVFPERGSGCSLADTTEPRCVCCLDGGVVLEFRNDGGHLGKQLACEPG